MPAPRHYSRWRGVFRLALLPLCALAVGLRCDDRAQLALATMAWSDDEGYVHVQAIRDTGQMLGGDCNGHVMGEAEEELGGIGGWVEVWQEGHRLLLNSTEDEVRFELPEGVDTYMWASVFDHLGRRVGESNVLHVGPPLAFSLEITHAGPDDGARDPARAGAFKWRDTEQTSVAFTATMAEWAKAAEIDAVIFLLNNQTHGMMRLGEAGLLNHQGRMAASFMYRHEGEVETGVHRLQLAALERGHAVPRVLSNTVWATVETTRVPLSFDSSRIFPGEALTTPYCEAAFASCLEAAGDKIPPNRQATEMMDAMDSCALSHCAMRRSEGDAEVRGLAKGTLIKMLDAHASAVAAGVKVTESTLQAARVLQLLDQGAAAARALATVLRLAGGSLPPPHHQCTYPGCKEVYKDACGLLHRIVLQGGRVWGQQADAGYMRHLDALVPPPADLVDGERYPLGSIAFGVLTTKPNYRSRGDAVKRTWFKHVAKGGFYGDAEDASLPITPYSLLSDDSVDASLREMLSEAVFRADYMSSMPKFFLMLHDMHRRHGDAQWFILAGDDNFIVPSHFPALLQHLDSSHKIIAGGPIGLHVGVGRYPSGGSSIIFSKGYVEAALGRLAPFAASWLQGGRGRRNLCHPCADIAFGVLSGDIGAAVHEMPCMHGMWPEYFALHSSRAVPGCASRMAGYPRVECGRPASFHYVQPRSMELLYRFFFEHRDSGRGHGGSRPGVLPVPAPR